MSSEPPPSPAARWWRPVALFGLPTIAAVALTLAWPPVGGALSVGAAVAAAVAAIVAVMGAGRT